MSQKELGLNFLNLLEIGTDELQWWAAELADRERAERMAQMALPGWFGSMRAGANGAGRYGWRIVEVSAGALRLQTVKLTVSPPIGLGAQGAALIRVPQRMGGILPDGNFIELPDVDEQNIRDANFDVVVVPNDGVVYTLVARRVLEVYEPGRITLAPGNTTVTGSNTKFSRYSSVAADPVPTVIRVDAVDSANGNESKYTIEAITDDGTMTVSPAPIGAGETVRYRVAGRFLTEPSVGEKDAHKCARVVWELRARVSTPIADALVAYDCYRSGGVLTLIDRRWANEYTPLPSPGAIKTVRLVPTVIVTSAFAAGVNIITTETNRGSAAVLHMDLAPCAVTNLTNVGTSYNGMLLAWVEADGIHAKRNQAAHPLSTGSGEGWDFEAEALKIAQTLITGFSLEQIQAGQGGYTHLVAYSTGGKITVQRSANNGNSFASLGIVWDPTIVNGAHTVNYPALLQTRSGRIILAAVYDTGAAKTIRYIYSDDYGTTWSVAGHAGTTIVSGTGNPRGLELVQDGWGNIHGFYVEDEAADELWTWLGISPADPMIDNVKALTANRGSKLIDQTGAAWTDFHGAIIGAPRAIGFFDGTCAVGFTFENAGILEVSIAHIKEEQVQYLETYATPDGSGFAGASPAPIALDISNTGDAFLVYNDTDVAANGDIRVQRLVPASVEMSPDWAGGR